MQADLDDLPQLKPLKSRRVPIQLARKRSHNGAAPPLSPIGSELARNIEATANAARDASTRAELRKSRRSTADRQSPLMPSPSPKHEHRHSRKVSEFDLNGLNRDSPKSECKQERSSPLSAGGADLNDDRPIEQRHAEELAELRAAHAAAEEAMIRRHDAELKASKGKRRKLTPDQ
jgi:hypothetical protein